MNAGIFLAGLGVFIYCLTGSISEIVYFIEMDPTVIDLFDTSKD